MAAVIEARSSFREFRIQEFIDFFNSAQRTSRSAILASQPTDFGV